MSGPSRGPVVVIGIGNEFRRDDGAGPAVIGQLRDQVPAGVKLVITDGEPTRLIEAWTGAVLAVVVDAVRAEPPHPGQVHRFVVDRPGAGVARPASSHGFGLDDAIALALALDRMPGRLIVHAIEAADLTQGTGLTQAVATAVGTVAAAILDDIGAGHRLPASGRGQSRKTSVLGTSVRCRDSVPKTSVGCGARSHQGAAHLSGARNAAPWGSRPTLTRIRSQPPWRAGHPALPGPMAGAKGRRRKRRRDRLRRWSPPRGTNASGQLASGQTALGVTGSRDVIGMRAQPTAWR